MTKLRYNDEIHAYWLDGKRCKGATSVAKIPDNTFYLDLWQKRMVAIGLATEPRLLEQVAAHLNDKKKLDEVCEKAQQAAKAHHAAEDGTTAHRFTEAFDLGEPTIQTELNARIVKAWTDALAAAGYETVPGMVERIAVHPELLIAGTFDRILRRRDGRLVIADLKTGAKAIEYPHAIAVQLALYAYAPQLAGILNTRGETDTFDPMPDVDKNFGIVIHMPTPDLAELYEVDIRAGWDCFNEVILPTYRWRENKTLCRPAVPAHPAGERSLPSVQRPTLDEGPNVPASDVTALRERYKALPETERALVDTWSAAVAKAGRSVNLKMKPSLWRWRMALAFLELAQAGADYGSEDEHVRWLLYGATKDQRCLWDQVPLGELFTMMTIEQAERLACLANNLGDITLNFGDDGKPVFSGPIYDALFAA